VRLRYLISRRPDTTNLTGLAHAAGFFDQAHFIKKFRAFTGQAPQQFFANTQYW
jgi:AraC-like DNA-binding protein